MESRRTGILRLKHLQESSEARAEEMQAQAERFRRLADPASAPRVVSAFNLFQTPEPLAARVAGMFTQFGRTLEPSAGLGRLYRAVRAIDQACEIVLVEQSKDCAGELYRMTEGDGAAQLRQADFLLCGPRLIGQFDSIIMNPPFKNGTDIRHVKHAASLLNPGGRLVSIVANGPRQREKLKPIATEWIDLPPRSFASEGTSVDTALIVIDRA